MYSDFYVMSRNLSPRFKAVAGFIVVASCSLPGWLGAQSPLTENLDLLQKWIDARKNLAETRQEWSVEKAALQDLIALRTAELEQLNEALESVQQESDVAEQERTDLSRRLQALRQAEAQVTATLEQSEARMRELITRLPVPLQQEIAPLSGRLPREGSEMAERLSTSQRVQTIVGILTQIEKYNDAVDLNEEMQDIDGSRIQVQTLYFGLAGAYWVDGAGTVGGVGRPGAEGWIWEREDALAPQILSMVRMYSGRTNEVEYVVLPVEVNP